MTTLSDCDDITLFDRTCTKKTIEDKNEKGDLLKNCVVGADAHVEDGEEGDDLYGGVAAVVAGCLSVLRTHDILVWIRIRIRGSMPLTNGSGFGSGS